MDPIQSNVVYFRLEVPAVEQRVNIPHWYDNVALKVALVKAIRSLTGMGFSEAKNIMDVPGVYYLTLSAAATARGTLHIESQCDILRKYGCKVGKFHEEILRALRSLATKAFSLGEVNFANEILQLILAEKLRRP